MDRCADFEVSGLLPPGAVIFTCFAYLSSNDEEHCMLFEELSQLLFFIRWCLIVFFSGSTQELKSCAENLLQKLTKDIREKVR